MSRIYLDNASTTPIFKEVIIVMSKIMESHFGNPSSVHSFGRDVKELIENARKKIAIYLKCKASEIVFTSGGTESNNLIIKNAVNQLKVKHIITSKIEHYSVLHVIDTLSGVSVSFVKIKPNGTLDYDHLEQLLKNNEKKTLISLMHVNNEIGNILNLEKVISLKETYGVLFHSDTVQSVGYFDMDLSKLNIDFMTGSAHKFHGPKGIGFCFFRNGMEIFPEILGGVQERGKRAGTENTIGIVGMEKALSICLENLKNNVKYLKEIKNYFLSKVKENIENIEFNGNSGDLDKSLHKIVSLRLDRKIPLLSFQLDLKGIAISSGSACQSGSDEISHVLKQILDKKNQKNTSIRFSFSRKNTKKDIDDTIKELKNIIS